MLIGDREASEFDTLGCSFAPETRSTACNFVTGLLCSKDELEGKREIPRPQNGIVSLEIAQGIRLASDVGGYKKGMHYKDLFRELAVRGMINDTWDKAVRGELGFAKNHDQWNRNETNKLYNDWLNGLLRDFPDMKESDLLERFMQSVRGQSVKLFNQLNESLVATLREMWSDNKYLQKAAEFLRIRGKTQKIARLLVASTESVAKKIEKLWVSVPKHAGPVFRGDMWADEWLDRQELSASANWPLSTSFKPSVAWEFWNRHLEEAIDEAKDGKPVNTDPKGKVFAILLASGVYCIDIQRRLGKDANLGGGKWLSCYDDEAEILLHPWTVLKGVWDAEEGRYFTVADVRGGNLNDPKKSKWALAVRQLFASENIKPPPLGAFESKLKRGSGIHTTDFEIFSLVVAFPPMDTSVDLDVSTTKRTRTGAILHNWTDFSRIQRYI